MRYGVSCPACDHVWEVEQGGEVGDCPHCGDRPRLVSAIGTLQFDSRETEMLREVAKFLNDHYAM